MNSLQKQQGIGLINLLILIVVGVFIGKFLFTVVPMYTENRYIVSGLKDLVAPGAKLQDMSDNDIRKKMNNFYMINNVRSEESQKIEIVRNVNGVVVKIDYEARAPFFYNIDLVLRFANHLDSARPGVCCSPLPEVRSDQY